MVAYLVQLLLGVVLSCGRLAFCLVAAMLTIFSDSPPS